jgi:hypothetical protein
MGGTARVFIQEVAEEAVADNTTKEERILILQSPL